MYTPIHFKAQELVPPTSSAFLYGQELLDMLFDEDILIIADKLREKFGAMVANTWNVGGAHQYRGWRPRNCAVGALNSKHKMGMAIDLIPAEISVNDLRDHIVARKGKLYDMPRITGIEMGVPWLHVDIGRKTFTTFGR